MGQRKIIIRSKIISSPTNSKTAIGAIIAIGFVFIFYCFSYLLKESIRVLSFTIDGDLWVLSESESTFYNRFYAALSLIIGQAIYISYTYSSSMMYKSRNRRVRVALMNDQYFTLTNFLMWFLKLGVFYGIYFATSSGKGYYFSGSFISFDGILVLSIIVLYLNALITLRKRLHLKKIKWMLLHFLLFVFGSISLSFLHPVNSKAINQILRANDIATIYQYELPSSAYFDPNHSSKWNTVPFYFAADSAAKNIIVKIDDAIAAIAEEEGIPSGIFTYNRNNLDYLLKIHKDIRMSFVYKLLEECYWKDIYRIHYAVVPLEPEFDQKYYDGYQIRSNLPYFLYESSYLPPRSSKSRVFIDSNFSTISVRHEYPNQLFVNDEKCDSLLFISSIRSHFLDKRKVIIEYDVDPAITYGDYIYVRSVFLKLNLDIKNEIALDRFYELFENLHASDYHEIESTYQIRVAEFSNFRSID